MFRSLPKARAGDVIILVTSLGKFRYKMVSTTVVSPTEVDVLKPDGHEILTLVTGYPYFIGPAPDRFIVRAERFILAYISPSM
jgi:sortase A